MWILIAITVAFGAELDRYPYRAEVTLEAPGRIIVPPALRSHADPADGSDLLLVDADGRAVPVAWARRTESFERLPLQFRPTPVADRHELLALDRAIDGIEVTLDEVDTAATIRLYAQRDGALVPHGDPSLVWRTADAQEGRLVFPPTRGPLWAEVEWHQRPKGGGLSWSGLRAGAGGLASSSLTLPVVERRVEETGWARYTVSLPGPMPVRWLQVHADGDVFDRAALVRSEPASLRQGQRGDARIRRIAVGTAAVEQTRIPVYEGPSKSLVLYVETAGQPPLRVDEVTLHLDGLAAVVPDPGPGPHTLYGGAAPGTSPRFEIQSALQEVFELSEAVGEVGPVERNPAFVPPEVRAGLVAPGAPLDPRAWAWRREVQGAGLSRIPLDEHALAHARADHGDVRVVDREGRPLPNLVVRRPVDHPMDGLKLTRTEEGAISRLSIEVPDPRVPVSTLTLATESQLFTRRVAVARVRGRRIDPLRAFEWVGDDRPVRVTLDVDAVVGDRLLVSIENGANAPLPVTEVVATRPVWEVVAWIPEEGAALWYGAPRESQPRYDLERLRDDVLARATAAAQVGAPVAVARVSRSLWERGIVLFGLGVLGLGLLGLTVSLLRAVPAAAQEPEPGPTDDGAQARANGESSPAPGEASR